MTTEKFLKRMQKTLDGRDLQIWIKNPQDVPEVLTEESIVRALFKRNNHHPWCLVATKKRSPKREITQQIRNSRSLEDLYIVCKYYLPKTNIFKVRDALKKIKETTGLSWKYCSTFRRVMFMNYSGYNENYHVKYYGI